MNIFSYFTKLISLCFVLALTTACGAIPVQEMSDARQAISAAESAGVSTDYSNSLASAYNLMASAENALQQGAYDIAREHALSAKEAAIRARVGNQQVNMLSINFADF